MNTKDEALKMALEWIEAQPEPRMIGAAKVVQSLRAALAQKDEWEPVAWMLECPTMTGDTGWILSWSQSGAGLCDRLQGEEHEKPLYTAPPKRQPLTDEKLRAMWANYAPIVGGVLEFARAIEAAHGIGVEHEPR